MTDETKEVANYDEMLAAMAKKAKAVEKPSTSTIACKSGILTYNGDPVGDSNALDVIIIASTHANLFYTQKYDPDNPVNPDCYAYGDDEDDMVPAAKAAHPQAERCSECKWNQWGSDPAGGRGKACKNSRVLGLVPAGTTVEDLPTAEIATFKLPVTSVKNWGQYVNKLDTLFQRPPLGLITTISIKRDLKTQFKVLFQNGPLVDNTMIMPLIKKADVVLEVLRKDYDANPELTEEEQEAAAEKAAKASARSKKF